MEEILKSLNWTTIISSGLIAVVLGTMQLIATRYTNRVLDHLEKAIKSINKKPD